MQPQTTSRDGTERTPAADVCGPPWLEGLNGPQAQAVQYGDGPLLVLAGAGTGKTRVLTARLACILHQGRARPFEILAVTFTNKAAQEMRERVAALLGGVQTEGWWLGTFHAICAKMLRRHADLVGLSQNFTILDPDDQIRLLKQIMEAANIDTKKWPPRQMIAHIDRWKDKARRPQDLSAADGGELAAGRLVEIYKTYQRRLKEINACDFGDLLLHMITIFRAPENAHILETYQNRFRYILVDEYQDTNVAQYMWLRLLAKKSGNLCCVGDDDQSIYGWRGAEVGNILRFEEDFPGAKIVRLEQNYRSTGHILSAAGAVIACNEGRLGKTLWSDDAPGEKVRVFGLWDGYAEARRISEEIETLRAGGAKFASMAVLVRAGFQMRAFEERFVQLGLPYRVIGGPRFYERAEIRDALAYLRVLAQPADDLAFERIINLPKRGIGDATVQILYAHARAQEISLYASAADAAQSEDLRPKVRGALSALTGDFERWRSLLGRMPHTELAAQILEESGYIQMWKDDKSPEAPGRVENLRELVSGGMAEFDSLEEFLEHVALVLETQDTHGGDYISIMTLHGAKGLEFDTVFLPGWEEGLFPSQRTMDENGLRGLEEERRLAYVGLTRARKRAYVSYALSRLTYGNWVDAIPSRFVDELPAEHILTEKDGGMPGQSSVPGRSDGRSVHWDSSGFRPKAATSAAAAPAPGYKAGAQVRHAKFGNGRVIHVDGHKLDIQFEDGQNRRVMDSFVSPAEG